MRRGGVGVRRNGRSSARWKGRRLMLRGGFESCVGGVLVLV